MTRLPNRRQWLRRYAWPALVTSGLCVVWAGVVIALLYWKLGITTSINGRRLTFSENVLLYLPGGAVCALGVHLVFLLILWATCRPFRWWVWALVVFIAGTPVAVECGRRVAEYLWQLNRSAAAWEATFAPATGMFAGWGLTLLADWILNIRRQRTHKQLIAAGRCVSCGYDLRAQIATGRSSCPECGTVITPSTSSEELPYRNGSSAR